MPRLVLFVVLLVGLTSCVTRHETEVLKRFEFKSPHMGTLFTITLYAKDAATGTVAAEAAFQRIAELDRMMTDYDPESELMRLSRSPSGQAVNVSDDLFIVLAKAQKIAAMSDGTFDVTIGPSVRLWRRARRTGEMPVEALRSKAQAAVGWQKVRLDEVHRTVKLLGTNMQLDLGGIAKGYAADSALRTLRAAGVSRALVAASGDLAIGDAPPGAEGWKVGVGVPDTVDAQLSRQFVLVNAGVSTSGDTEQFVEIEGRRYSHILDPRTGLGLTNRIQATIVARCTTDSDALATAVCVQGEVEGLGLIRRWPGAAAIVIRREGERLEMVSAGRLPRVAKSGVD